MTPEEFNALVDEASAGLAQELDRMSVLQTECNWNALRETAHRLRGSIGSLGCDLLAEQLNELEATLRAEPGTDPAPLQLEEIRRLAQQCVVALKAQGQRS